MISTVLVLFFLGALLIAVAGIGQFILQRLGCSFTCRTEEFSFIFAIGLGSLMMAVLFLGLVHLLYVWILYLLIILFLIIGNRHIWQLFTYLRHRLISFRAGIRSFYFWLLLLIFLCMVFSLVRALGPPYGATDPLAYQMALPKIFLRNHYLSFEPTITGALYPSNIGLLYIVGLALRNGSLAQTIHWLLGILCLVALIGFGSHHFTRQTGIWGAVIFSCVPIFVYFTPLGYVDIGLCFFQFMAFWAMLNWVTRPNMGMLLLAGVLTGLAMGIKHQGIATLFVGMIVFIGNSFVNRERWYINLEYIAIFGLTALILSSPWYVRSYLIAHNPIWPLANDIFHGFPFNQAPVILASTSGNPGQTGLGKLVISLEWLSKFWNSQSPWIWTFRPDGLQKAIGMHFIALVPGIFLYIRNRKIGLLLIFCFFYYLILMRVLHANPRYGLVLFTFLAIGCGFVAEKLCSSRLKILPPIFKIVMIITILFNLIWGYFLAKPVIKVVTGQETKAHFLQEHEANFRVFQFINQNLPESSRILFQGIVKGFYCERTYMWDHPYQAIIDYKKCKTPEQLLKLMENLKITHIVRMIHIPPIRRMYPQYFQDPYHEAFRKKYLNPLYYDNTHILFEIDYGKER